MPSRPTKKLPGPKIPQPEISRELILAELKSVCASRQFTRSTRLQQFLHFMIQRTLKGDIDSLKEYTIGVDVFGRNETFDQRKDAIVRVQANRLRRKLKLYYATEGASSQIRITLPPGGFIPLFIQRKEPVSVRNPEARLPHRANARPE
jgi:hypothetical protein